MRGGDLFLIPYLQLQITGLGIIVSVASYDGIGRGSSMGASPSALLTAFVLAGGMRAVAWVSVLKDALMVPAALAIGIGCAAPGFGGIAPMFDGAGAGPAGAPAMPGATETMGTRGSSPPCC